MLEEDLPEEGFSETLIILERMTNMSGWSRQDKHALRRRHVGQTSCIIYKIKQIFGQKGTLNSSRKKNGSRKKN